MSTETRLSQIRRTCLRVDGYRTFFFRPGEVVKGLSQPASGYQRVHKKGAFRDKRAPHGLAQIENGKYEIMGGGDTWAKIINRIGSNGEWLGMVNLLWPIQTCRGMHAGEGPTVRASRVIFISCHHATDPDFRWM